MDNEVKISQFFDDEGRLKQFPASRKIRPYIYKELASHFEEDRFYTEKEVNEIIEKWHTFGDFFLLRRELIEGKFLGRERDGSKYWLIKRDDVL